MEYLLSFAQDREDIILYHMLRDVRGEIRWIDVGANDPVDLSVTKLFSNMGGYGVNIEPQKAYIKKLNADRPKDVNLEVGISDIEGALELCGAGTAASFDSKNQWVKGEGRYTVPVVTLKHICEDNFKKNEAIHFLKIDVEGWERQCLLGMDFEHFRPWIVCIESTEPGTDIPSWYEWESILLENSYVFAGMSGANRYYVSSEQEDRKARFCTAEEVDAFYHIIPYSAAKTGVAVENKLHPIYIYIYRIYRTKPMAPVRKLYHIIRDGRSQS